MKTASRLLAAGLAATLLAGAYPALAYDGQALAPQAKITIEEARSIALKAHPGTIADEELEKEGGGLRYSFDIKSGAATQEIGVDAATGQVVENKPADSD